MPFYEFECPRGHVTERLVPMGTKDIVCAECCDLHPEDDGAVFATRILSPTPTTFVFAGGRKR